MNVTINTRLNANCGCGENYRQGESVRFYTAVSVVKAAEAHAEATGHSMHFTGEIKASKTVVQAETFERRPRKAWTPRKDLEFQGA